MSFSLLENKVSQALRKKNYENALALYLEMYDQQLLVESLRATQYAQHLVNAASLARKKLYDMCQADLTVSIRFQRAVEMYLGATPRVYSNKLQKPNFFHMPDLPSKPFYDIPEIPGLQKLYDDLKNQKQLIEFASKLEKQSYVDVIGNTPKEDRWQSLKGENWGSRHLLKAGAKVPIPELDTTEFVNCFANSCVPDCPPHAPEVFISQLLPSIEIPPHFGVSNIKLTAHLPIQVNSGCYLEVGNEKRYWDDDVEGIVFDDSYIHSAGNLGKQSRTVLIFDVWNPNLQQEEKQAIRNFMRNHHEWSNSYGKMAALDKR
ncbi:MAG: hypothetical protein GJ680_04450 [Alteromonadaceae bacterium]|nr:hypothetical protein [Alteromonadaceae bacterium]